MGAYIRLSKKKSHTIQNLLVFAVAVGTVGFCVNLAWTEDEAQVPRVRDLQTATGPLDLRPVTISEPSVVAENVAMVTSTNPQEVVEYAVAQAHAQCFQDEAFPSVKKCGTCHPKHYREWSVSPHAYAQLSPVANTLFMALNELVTGTIGDFCLRCHTPVGQAIGEPRTLPNADRHPAAREGITCVVCHRINQPWGKQSGRMALIAGGVWNIGK